MTLTQELVNALQAILALAAGKVNYSNEVFNVNT